MKKNLILVSLITILVFTGHTALFSEQVKNPKKDSYTEFHKKLVTLYKAKKFEETRDLLEKNIGNYPEKFNRFAFNLSLVYGETNQFGKGIAILKEAHKKGIWFNTMLFKSKFYKGYMELEEFKEVVAGNNALYKEAQKNAKSGMEIVVPENFDKTKKYPLFIALHGGGENLKVFKPRWTSDKMKKEYIVAYLQSSQLITPDGFGWEDYAITQKEVKIAMDKILKNYPVDTNKIVIGGFSSGGGASLYLAFKAIIPVKGFVILCPQVPKEVNETDVLKAAKKGVKGTFLTTGMDNRLDIQKKFVDMFKKAELGHRFIITPNIGHWYPKNLNQKIDKALEHIFGK